ncbi:hypothetical protein J437_LFUL002835 [Ladona fulva]|uniref:Sugar phosphate transporter domain-containing protein n=1 Tax=Ladona fulva TaxID=123851 RepID=A0A8K0P0M0_LADFU|nr:hypothetical protein J437_LFUL002835 [Ladona fulva]
MTLFQMLSCFKKCNHGFFMICVRTLGLISLYYTLSIGLVFYQHWLLKFFRFPLSISVCHMVVKFILAGICRTLWECYHHRDRVTIDWKNYMLKVAPTGLASGLDIGISNWGLELVTVSLYTMTKSTAIIFIMGFAILLKLEEKSWKAIVIVLMISGGLILFTFEATAFDVLGFILVLLASCISGLRWTLAQLVMQKSKLGLHNPVDMVYHVQPWMIVSVLPIAIAIEGKSFIVSNKVFCFDDWDVLFTTIWMVAIGTVMAFLMEVAEYMVVSFTSSLTLSVAGIFKELMTVMLAVNFNGDNLSVINYVGFLLCLGGIIYHVIHRTSANHVEEESMEVSHVSSAAKRTKWENKINDSHIPLLDTKGEHSFEASLDFCDIESDGDSVDDTEVLFSILQRDR